MSTLSPTPYSRQDGFTLVELLIVVLIIGILASIAIPIFNGQRNKAKDSQAMSSVRNGLSAAKSHYTSAETFETANAAALANEESSLTFEDGFPAIAPGSDQADPKTVYVSDQTKENITLCSVSKGTKVFCLKGTDSGTRFASNDLGQEGATLPLVAAGSANAYTSGWKSSWNGTQVASNLPPPGGGTCADPMYANMNPAQCGGTSAPPPPPGGDPSAPPPGGDPSAPPPGGTGGPYQRITLSTGGPGCGASCDFQLTASTGMMAEAYSMGFEGGPSASWTQTSKSKSGDTLTITGTYSCTSGITGLQLFENGSSVDSFPLTCN